uniref:Protein disulfide-isomerase n=1 Tax=Panagrolaimus superbus TaxID=310955 RepID=A0A914Y5W4_9BILA
MGQLIRILSLLFTFLVIINAEYEKDAGVVILTDSNFDDFLAENPTVLIEFYAPWCGHCKTLAPEYEKAAKSLKNVPLAKVDATVETELNKRFKIEGFPTLKFWKDGENPIDYDGGRDADSIVQWIKEKTDPNYKPPAEEVVALTVETFDEFISDKPIMLLEFYAPWCGHCKSLAPEYEKAAKKLKEHNIPLAKVDATVEKRLGDQFGVSGYPTLKILRNGRRFDYDGPRTADGIVKYMLQQAKPAAKPLKTVKAAQRLFSKDGVTIIGFFATEESKSYEAFTEAAEMTRPEFTSIGYTTDPEVMKHYKAKPNDIVLFYPEIFWSKFEPRSRTYRKDGATVEDILAFWRDNAAPLVGQMTRNNAATQYTKYPLVVIYYNVDFGVQYREGTQFWRNKILPIANKYKDQKYRFAIADEEEFNKELTEVGLGDSGLEHNVLVFGFDGKKYPMDPEKFDEELEENLEAFMKVISSGKAKPYVKSQPSPKNDKGPVKTLVASNFDKIVNDESKDQFEPKYAQLAAKLKSEQPNLILAKFDATANDAPKDFNVEGFPTIYFAPSGKKTTPVKYSGNRDLDHLTEFMKKHAVKSFQKKEEL